MLKPLFINGYYGSVYEIDWRLVGTGAIIVSGMDDTGHEIFKFKAKGKTSHRVTLVPGMGYSIAVDLISQNGKWRINVSPVEPEIIFHALRTVSADYELREKQGRGSYLDYNFTVANDTDQTLVVDLQLFFADQYGYRVESFIIEIW